MSDLEHRMVAKLTDAEEIARVYELGLQAEVFETDLYRSAFTWAINYWLNTGMTRAPTWVAIAVDFPQIKPLYDIEESTEWLVDALKQRFKINVVQEIMHQALDTMEQNPDATLHRLRKDVDDAIETAGLPEPPKFDPKFVAERKIRLHSDAEAKRQFEEEQKPQEQAVPLRDLLLTLDDLAKLPPTKPLIDGLVYRNTLAQLSGGPGTYKTFLAITMGCCLAVGVPFAEYAVPAQATVVYVAAEGANDVLKRILAWCEVWEVDPDEVRERFRVLPLPIQLGDTIDVSRAVELVAEIGADLLILDTRARCTLGLEENSATEQGQAIEAVEAIRRAADCTVLAVHHTPRTGNAGRGSNAWDGAVWSDLRVEGESLQVKLHCEKHKDVESGCDHFFSFRPHTVSEELMPEALLPSGRKTLVMFRSNVQGSGQNSLNRTARQKVLNIIWTIAPPEGFTASELRLMTQLSRTSVHEATTWGVGQEYLRNDGSPKRSRWVPGEQRPPWLGPED